MRQSLQLALDEAKILAPADLPKLLGELEEFRATVFARLAAPAVEARPDQLLDIDQASQRLNVSRDYLYRNARRLPFTKRIGRKLLFSSAGLDSYVKRAR